MKIAFFCDAYTPTRNGVAVSAQSTARELRSRGHEVVIYAPHYTGHFDSDPHVERFAASHWFRARDYPVVWPAMPHLNLGARLRFQRKNYDVVHTHSPFTMGSVGATWARQQGKPVVFTFHTLYHRYLHYVPLPPGVTRSYILWTLSRYCRRCRHIIAPSRPVAQIVHRFNSQVPCSVVPTGVDVTGFDRADGPAARRRWGIAADEVVLLYVGRMVAEKNLAFLLHAVAPLLREERKVRLVLAGGGPLIGELRSMAESCGVTDRVVLTGFLDRSELVDLYAGSNLFVFASRTETQGISIAEALSAGLPCVVVGAMGAAESVQDGLTGLIVPPRQGDFRDAVSGLIEDPERCATMSRHALESASRLTIQHSVDRLLEIYEGVLGK